MFDLDQAIRRWRRSMSARLSFPKDAVTELEAHLRDAVQKEVQNGSTPEVAWTAALAQLGSVDAIAAEYSKLPRYAVWRWWPARIVLGAYAAIAILLGWFIVSRLIGGRVDALLASHVLTVTLGYVAVLAVGAMASWSILSRAIRGWTPAETEVLRQTTYGATIAALVLTATGVVLGALWVRNHAGHFWSWDPREIGGVTVVAWNVFMLLRIVRGRSERVEMLLGVAGNALVVLCWLIPMLLPTVAVNVDHGRTAAMRILVLAGVLLPALCGLAFLPPGRLRFRRAD